MNLLLAAPHAVDADVVAPMRCGLPYQLSRLLRRSHPALDELGGEGDDVERSDAAAGKSSSKEDAKPWLEAPLTPLDRASPYIGFWRHAPPSYGGDWSRQISPPLGCQDEMPALTLDCSEEEYPSDLLASVPGEVWELALSWVVEVRSLGSLQAVSRAFHELPRSPAVWQGRTVRIAPEALQRFAPRLHFWLPAWKHAGRLVIPKSTQLAAEVARHSPHLPVEVAWRFDAQLKGHGVEVLDCGRAVRRVGEDGLVVLGDAPLARPFFEVRLDERALEDPEVDNPNDFGIGVTICDPKDIDDDVRDVADDVPQSWVVDFARSFTVLSVGNCEAARCDQLCARDLAQGDRIGLRVLPETMEVFVNGTLRAVLRPGGRDRIPIGRALYPVLDLCGQAIQISRSDAEGPEL